MKDNHPELSLEKFTELYNTAIYWWYCVTQEPDIESGRMLVTMHSISKKSFIAGVKGAIENETTFYIPSATHYTPELKKAFHFSDQEVALLKNVMERFIIDSHCQEEIDIRSKIIEQLSKK